MPNWCRNELYINFSKRDVYEELKFDFLSSTFELNNYFKSENECPNDVSFSEYWGTKWRTVEFCFEFDDDKKEVYCTYDTAWSPNIPVLEAAYQKLIQKDKELHLSCFYEEIGSGYRGLYQDGEDFFYDIDDFFTFNNIQANKDYEIEKLENGLFKLKLTNKDEEFLLLEKTKENRKSCLIDGEEDYIFYSCFSETLGENFPVFEYNNQYFTIENMIPLKYFY